MVKIISDLEYIIQSDPTRWLRKVDPENKELLLSIGCFWENMEMVAESLGYSVQTEILANGSKEIDIMKVKLIKSKPAKNNTDAITRATSVRSPYVEKNLQTEHLNELKPLLPPDHFAYFPKQSKEGEWISKNLIKANKKQTFDEDKQTELSEWFRFSSSEAKERGDGLTPEMIGLSGIKKFFWYRFMKKESALSESFRNQTVDKAKKQVEGVAGFIIITGDDSSILSLLQSGREFQSLTVKCTELKVGLHPMSQLMEESPWKEQLSDSLGLTEPVRFILRIGYPSGNLPEQGIRRNLTDFVYHE